mmetsp:Transcript_15341/g.29602  ORF Transcript_15341/g.29602 Transcript_15341/m.29602 type:complete len:373 (-) Transcript_15341:52-1170(-)
MLGTLGDPFTRLLRPVAAKAYNMQVDGQVESFGMVAIPAELSDGREITIVAQVAEGGAAEAAGIRVGDELVAVNGRLTSKMSMKMLQLVLDEGGRNKEVVLTINQDGVVRKVRIYRTALAYNPVQYGILPLQRYSPASTSSESPAEGQQDVQVKLGYIRLGVFSTNAGKEVRAAVKDLEEMGAQGYILDLRNNSGGAIAAGMEVAKVWMDNGERFAYITGRAILDDGQEEVPLLVEDVGDLISADIESLRKISSPVVLLVNNGTASASELLAGAMHDVLGSVLVGNEKTFGKGRTQTVLPLEDGSSLLLTTARFFTPNHTTVDGVGLVPDVSCSLDIESQVDWNISKHVGPNNTQSLWDDPCVQRAASIVAS